jgi:hypothetical protein
MTSSLTEKTEKQSIKTKIEALRKKWVLLEDGTYKVPIRKNQFFRKVFVKTFVC